jgi:glycosyltransferase involved in cell wall biosynthesis
MTPARRSVIFVSYYFDPSSEIGGVRPRSIGRYLPDYGWLPIVVTAGSEADDLTTPGLLVRHVSTGSLVASAKARLGIQVTTERPAPRRSTGARLGTSADSLARGIATELGGLLPDSLAWSRRAGDVASALARRHGAEAILSSSPANTANLVAWSASRRAHLPWVADLRDLWSQRPYRTGTRLRRLPDSLLERLVFRRASSLVTVSDPLAVKLRELHTRQRIVSIPSGIDPELVAPGEAPLVHDFRILYAGRIYEGHQDLEALLVPLRTALDRGLLDPGEVRVDLLLLHPLSTHDAEIIERLGLRPVVHVEQSVSRDEVIARERRAQILLHLRWDDPDEPGILTGKLFEYLAARRPILSTGRYRDTVVTLLERTGAGAGTTTHEETAAWLADAYEVFRSSGRVPFEATEEQLELLDVRSTVKAIAAELDRAVATGRGR